MTAPLARLNGPPSALDGFRCERCAAESVQWLTPRERAHQGAMLFCTSCKHITIKTRRGMLAEAAILLAA